MNADPMTTFLEAKAGRDEAQARLDKIRMTVAAFNEALQYHWAVLATPNPQAALRDTIRLSSPELPKHLVGQDWPSHDAIIQAAINLRTAQGAYDKAHASLPQTYKDVVRR